MSTKEIAVDLSKTFTREFEIDGDTCLVIHQSEIGDVGCVVWDAAIVLSSYLRTDDFLRHDGRNILDGKRVIELGAGTGVVGVHAAFFKAKVILTDLEDFVPLMQKNIDCNKNAFQNEIKAHPLKWGQDLQEFLPPPDFVLLADCIYYEESLEPLVQTMRDLCAVNTIIFCCYEERLTPAKIALEKKFHQLIEKFFSVEKIPLERQDLHFRSEDIHILKMRLKK